MFQAEVRWPYSVCDRGNPEPPISLTYSSQGTNSALPPGTDLSLTNKKTFCRRTDPFLCSEQTVDTK